MSLGFLVLLAFLGASLYACCTKQSPEEEPEEEEEPDEIDEDLQWKVEQGIEVDDEDQITVVEEESKEIEDVV